MALTFTPTVSAGSAPISTTSQSTAAYTEPQTLRTFELTFGSGETHPVGTFECGNVFVVTSAPGSVVASSPASQVLNDYVAYGIMKDCWYGDDGNGEGQGFEEMAGVSFNSTVLPYVSAKNIAPGVHGNGPITWAAGDEFSLTIAMRKLTATTPDTWDLVDTYITITFLPTAPPVGTYMPARSQLAPKTLFNANDLNLSVLPSITFPGTWTDTPAQSLAKIPHDLARIGASGGNQRRLRMDKQYGTSTSNYDAHSIGAYATCLMQLWRSDISTADRDAILARVIRHGIEAYGVAERGYYGNSSVAGGAGQSDNGEAWTWYTAFLLGHADMLAEAKLMKSQMRAQSYWGTTAWTGRAVPSSMNNRQAGQTYFDEMLNWPFTAPDFLGTNKDADYGVIGKTGNWYVLAVAGLQNGPGGVNGAEAMLEGGAFDHTNSATGASALAFMCRYRHWTPWHMGSYDPGQKFRDMFDLVWPLTGLTKWTGQNPDQLEIGSIDITTPGNGQIGFSIVGEDYSNGTTPNRQDFRYSLDGVQWVESLGVGTSGTVTGLLQGVKHFYGMRQAVTANGSAGVGPWSLNYGIPPTNADRATVTTTGTESAAPSYSGRPQPQVHAKKYPAWWAETGNYEPVSGTISTDQIILAAGIGYPSGNFDPATDATYVWQESDTGAFAGEETTAATSKVWEYPAASTGKHVRFGVTIDNGVNTPITVYSASVQLPTLPAIPATTLFDTTWNGLGKLQYESEVAGAVLSNATLDVDTTLAINDEHAGSLVMNQTSSWPSAKVAPANPALANKTYDVELHGAVRFNYDDGTPERVVNVRLINDSDGTDLVPEISLSWLPGVDEDREFNTGLYLGTFATGATPPVVRLVLSGSNSSGGGPQCFCPKVVVKEQTP